MRIGVGNDVNLIVGVFDDDTLTDPTSLPVVEVKTLAGVTAASGTVTEVSTGIYKSKFESLNDPNLLIVSWTFEVGGLSRRVSYPLCVDGGYLFELHELRKFPGLDDKERFPIEALAMARDEVTSFFNDFTSVAFVETYAREVFDGYNRSHLFLNRSPARRLLSVKVEGATIATAGWTVSSSGVVRAPTPWTGNRIVGQGVEIDYTYGMDYTPADVKRAALKLASSWILTNETNIPDRARMMTTQWATFQLSVASDEYPTGIPEVDSVLRRRRFDVPSFA